MMGYRFVIVLLCLLASASATAQRDISGGVQKCHLGGVLHLTPDGRILREFDPERSFIPLGVYAVYNPELKPIAAAGFNTVMLAGSDRLALNNPEEREEMMRSYRENDIQLVPTSVPSDDALRALAKDSHILTYYMIDEPNRFLSDKNDPIERVYEDVLEQQRRAWKLDPGRGTLVNLVPKHFLLNDPAQVGWWHAFNAICEISCIDCYEVTSAEYNLDDVARTVADLVKVNEDRRPSLFVAQGHKDKRVPPFPDNIYPTPEQFRCEYYTAIVHGAVGVIIFKLQEER